MSFSDQIKAFNDKTKKAAENVYQGTALGLFAKIIKRTPVKTGRLRGNWQCTLNAAASGETETTAAAALSKAKRTTGSAKLTDSIYLVNNLPYAEVIENGRSQQAPSGMVKVTITEFQRIVEENVRRNK